MEAHAVAVAHTAVVAISFHVQERRSTINALFAHWASELNACQLRTH